MKDDTFTMVHFDTMTAIDCANYVLAEYGHGGKAIAVEDNGNLSVRIKRFGQCDVVTNGAIAVAIKIRMRQEAEKRNK